MLKLDGIRINGGIAGSSPRLRLADFSKELVLEWSLESSRVGAVQTAYRAVLSAGNTVIDSGYVQTKEQICRFSTELADVSRAALSLTVTAGEESARCETVLYNARVPAWGKWLMLPEEKHIYFEKNFEIKEGLKEAALFVCTLGLAKAMLNGAPADDAVLEPIHTDYSKTALYAVYPEAEKLLHRGENKLSVLLGNGWRRNKLVNKEEKNGNNKEFSGPVEFTVCLRLTYENGATELVCSDESWLCREGPIRENDLFDGETYDASYENVSVCSCLKPQLCDVPDIVIAPMLAEPIVPCNRFAPRAVWTENGRVIYDMGRNLCGRACITLPAGLQKGQKLVLRHGEELAEEGGIFTAPLRKAKAQDCYIASGLEKEGDTWQPVFTYHGFRYIEATGDFLPHSIEAVELRSNLKSIGDFTCGSALATRIHEICVQTERSNQIGILTDCPQRDERQGWLNDATVRFEETPYNFDIGRIFPKVLGDIADTQEAGGNIKDTAPFVFGNREADPVCSSFLVAAWQCYMHTGNREPMDKYFPSFERWENFLLSRSENFLCTYTTYGDWAGPNDFCKNDTGTWRDHRSAVTPGEFMSTGYMYHNAVLLSCMAEKPETKKKWQDTAENIKNAMLNKWFDGENGKMCTGSQGCQSFALWLGIISEEARAKAAKLLAEDLARKGLTTGNLCSRYILDVLTQNGYTDAAWGIITNENYPSVGYMLQNEATTVWERFELKKDPGMNSHNHPMYGSMDYWFYAYLLGMKPAEPGWRKIKVEPHFPEKLLSASGTVHTARGAVSVRWVKRYGALTLWVQVPIGCTAEIVFDGKNHAAESGLTILSKQL